MFNENINVYQTQVSCHKNRLIKRLISVALSVLILAMSVLPIFAASPSKTVNASATLAYNIKGLKHNLAVQKFYIASTYLYVTQRSGGTVYLSRCLMNGSDATYLDEMTLTNCGHGQTLDMYTYNNINYLYVSSKADPSTTYYWSLQVARLQYKAGATYDYTDLHRFTYMNYANKTGSSLGTTYRVDGGGNSTYTVFRVQTTSGTVTYSIYNTAALNKLLDNNEQVQMNSSAAVNACVASFTQSGDSIVRPNSSFQGIDMIDNTKIYVTGGAEGDTPKIALMSNTGAYKTLVNITNVGSHEIEGVQTKDGRVYFNIVSDPTNKKDTQKIYYVSDGIF
ncbi:helveticin J family class III bacteriocin [Ruminiclostridium josui]|uniref:helveticin J family class III bacteriocin n=1 Tax=Ruminiclostridium josui TaxID=1499 RepID=UPI0004BC9FBB|nr:helveticin J family class III bacteriocin [Ruminiclostridium josui]